MEEVVVVYRDNGFQDLKTSLLQALRVSSLPCTAHMCSSYTVINNTAVLGNLATVL